METILGEKVMDLATRLSYAESAKEAARLRIQCSLGEWEIVKEEAKRLYHVRQAVAKVPQQRLYRA